MSDEGQPTGEWRPDPWGRFENRFHDGTNWTDQVAQGGRSATDPFFDPAEPLPAGASPAAETGGTSTEPKRKRGVLVAVAVLIAVVAAAGAAFALTGGDDEPEATAATSTTVAESTTTTEAPTTTSTEPAIEDPEDVVGSNISSTLGDLIEAGFEVEQVEVIDESADDGEILEAEETTPGTVVVTVARPPVTRHLEELEPVDGFGFGNSLPFNVSGTTYSHGVTLDSGGFCDDPAEVEYDLGRDYRVFAAAVGLLDTSEAGARNRVEISIDGQIVATHDIGLGETVDVVIPVEGALRLRIAMTPLVENECGDMGFGDGRLQGVPSEVPPLPN